MNGKKAKLIKKMADHFWNNRLTQDQRNKWGKPSGNNALGVVMTSLATAKQRYHRAMKKRYEKGDFTINTQITLTTPE